MQQSHGDPAVEDDFAKCRWERLTTQKCSWPNALLYLSGKEGRDSSVDLMKGLSARLNK